MISDAFARHRNRAVYQQQSARMYRVTGPARGKGINPSRCGMAAQAALQKSNCVSRRSLQTLKSCSLEELFAGYDLEESVHGSRSL